VTAAEIEHAIHRAEQRVHLVRREDGDAFALLHASHQRDDRLLEMRVQADERLHGFEPVKAAWMIMIIQYHLSATTGPLLAHASARGILVAQEVRINLDAAATNRRRTR